MMTVKQLKELLNNYPDDMLVVFEDSEGEFSDVEEAEIIVLKRDKYYRGNHGYPTREGDVTIKHLRFY